MTTPYEELASALTSSSGSLAGKEWAKAASMFLPALKEVTVLVPATEHIYASPLATRLDEQAVRLDKQPAAPQELPLTPNTLRVQAQSAGMQILFDDADEDLRGLMEDARRRANRAFNVALSFGFLGGAIILAGAILALAGQGSIGIVSGVAGIVSAATSKIFAGSCARAESELGEFRGDLRAYRQARVGLWLADHMSKDEERDEAIRSIIKQLQTED